MNQREVFQHYSNIIDNLINTSDFYKIYFQEPYSLDDDIQITDTLSLNCGISRGCLVDSTYDYVVKFQLNNDECECCDKEIAIYDDAVGYGIEKCFVRPIFIGTYRKTFNSYLLADVVEEMNWYCEEDFYSQFDIVKDNHKKQSVSISINLFAYPRVETNISLDSYSIDDEHYAQNSTSPLKEYNLAIAAEFIGEYGEELYNVLTNFLYDWNVNDIHYGNIGRYCGHICIIDYAGA